MSGGRLKSALALAIAVATALMVAMGFNFPLFGSMRISEFSPSELYATGELGIYERHFEFEVFNSVLDVHGINVNFSGYFSLDKLAWAELKWVSDGVENTVTLDSLPPDISYECKCNKDNVEFSFKLSLHGLTVRVKIPGTVQGTPTLALAFYLPY